jgi:hypothetical protein
MFASQGDVSESCMAVESEDCCGLGSRVGTRSIPFENNRNEREFRRVVSCGRPTLNKKHPCITKDWPIKSANDENVRIPMINSVLKPHSSLKRCCFRTVYGHWKRWLWWFGFAGGYKTHPPTKITEIKGNSVGASLVGARPQTSRMTQNKKGKMPSKQGLLWPGFAGGYKTHPYKNT